MAVLPTLTRIVDLSVQMKSRGAIAAATMAEYALPLLRIQPLTRSMREEMGLPVEAEYVWAIIQARKGQQDEIVEGGWARSQSAAEQAGRDKWVEIEERWARQRVERIVRDG